jgi:hypothetical protein
MGRLWGLLGRLRPSNAMACHNPAQGALARVVCAVSVYWVALAWLGEMILAARTMQPSITRRIDGPKDVHGALLEVSRPGSEWVCQAD